MSEEEQLAYAVQMSLAAENSETFNVGVSSVTQFLTVAESGMEVDDGVAHEVLWLSYTTNLLYVVTLLSCAGQGYC